MTADRPPVYLADQSAVLGVPARSAGRPIRRGRLVAGIALHFLAPGYGLVLVTDAALGHAPHAWAAWLPHALHLGGWFLAAYGAAAVVASGVAALADRRQRVQAAPPAVPLAPALAAAQGRFGAAADAQLARIASLAAPTEAGPIAQDIIRLLAASSAAPASDPGVQQGTAQALAILADALEQDVRQRSGAAQDQARVMARYIDLKYRPGSDGQDTV